MKHKYLLIKKYKGIDDFEGGELDHKEINQFIDNATKGNEPEFFQLCQELNIKWVNECLDCGKKETLAHDESGKGYCDDCYEENK